MLAMMFGTGRGVQQSDENAIAWLRKSAKLNYPKAQIALGMAYEKGFGVEKNHFAAIKWYQKAAKQGNEKAQESLVRLKNKISQP